MKSSRFLGTNFKLKAKIVEKNQTLDLALNCYFLYTLLPAGFYSVLLIPFQTNIATIAPNVGAEM